MQTIRHLLCPVDLSEPSAQALRYGAALSSVVNGDLTILCVRAAAGHQPDAGKSSDTSLESFVSNIIGFAPSLRLLERQGEPVTAILSTAVDIASDVIVMGTHGRTGLQRLLLGSVAERVIRRSPVPVLTVSPGMETKTQGSMRLASVLCAVDFSEPSSRAVDYAASIAKAAGARLVLAHVLEWSEETETLPSSGRTLLPSSVDDAIARLSELLTHEMRVPSDPELVVAYGTPADEVLRFVHERHIDLVVLGVRPRNPIDLAVFGSTTQRLIREGACAVLAVRTV
jgi:nucleotide-binding universal stress UspA family protein